MDIDMVLDAPQAIECTRQSGNHPDFCARPDMYKYRVHKGGALAVPSGHQIFCAGESGGVAPMSGVVVPPSPTFALATRGIPAVLSDPCGAFDPSPRLNVLDPSFELNILPSNPVRGVSASSCDANSRRAW
jgi:hypothetical protein